MAFPSSSCFFTSPSFINTQQNSSSSIRSNNFKLKSQTISANFATAERTTTPPRSSRINNNINNTNSSLYEVLGIQMGADKMEIKAAYRKLARVLHPDVGNNDSSADEFMKVNSAYTTLSDPGKRADYDRSLFIRERMVVRSSYSSTGYGGRRWETDQCW